MYFTRDEKNKTQKMQQNPGQWGCNYFQCILATEIFLV